MSLCCGVVPGDQEQMWRGGSILLSGMCSQFSAGLSISAGYQSSISGCRIYWEHGWS